MSKKLRAVSEPPAPADSPYDPFKLFNFLNIESPLEEKSRQSYLMAPHEWSLENSVKRAANCPCFQVIDQQDLKSCKLCQGTLPVVQVLNEMGNLKNELTKATDRMDIANIKADHAQMELSECQKKLEVLTKEVEQKEKEVEAVRRDLDTIGEKLVDELERRGELQHAKDALQEELEELTRSLFEEANSMVSKEAKARQEYQDQQGAIKKELDATRLQLQMEQGQLRELKLRMENVVLENQRLKSKRAPSMSTPRVDVTKEPSFDRDDLSYFTEFIQLSSNTKLTKINSIKYLANILEDDILPCLRFGMNPKITGRKLVDSILSNVLFVEEMNSAQITELELRDENLPLNQIKYNQVAEGSPETNEPVAENVSTSQTSVFSRLSSVYKSMRSSSMADGSPGCCACGKTSEKYRYQFKITDISGDAWYPICLLCRAKIVAVCNFYNFIRHLRQGLYSSKKPKDLYFESLKLRRTMFYTRLGLDIPKFGLNIPASVKPNNIFVETGMYADPLLTGKTPTSASAGSGLFTFKETEEESSKDQGA